MIEGWAKMSPKERQEAFLNLWVSGEGLTFDSDETKAAYQYRAGLMRDAILLKKSPDRVPVVPLITFAPVSLAGYTGKEAMNDVHVLGKANVEYVDVYQPDAAGVAPMVTYAQPLEVLDYHLYKWPGHGVKDHLYYQFNEKEYMKADEYDHLISDVSDYWYRVWLPRTHGALAGLAEMSPVYGTMELPMSPGWLIPFGTPPVQAALKALMEAGSLALEWIQNLVPYLAKINSRGYPVYAGGACKAPLDVLSDSFRGTSALMMDMYRRPDKVKKALEVLTPIMVNLAVRDAHANRNPIVFIPLHKGADGFMSNEQFAEFYWPGLKAVMMGLIEQGCIPCCFVEGGYNQRLEFLTDVPDASCAFIFDRTDMARAREILGGKSCIGGGFPVSLILTGTVEKVEAETRKLLDIAAGDGGYILSVGCAMDDAKEDTLKAFIKAGKEYGKY